MAEDDGGYGPQSDGGLEPGDQPLGLRLFRRPFCAQHQPAVGVDVAQARKAVDDEAKTALAFEGIVPAIRLIAVEPGEQPFGVALQSALEFARAAPRLG